LTANPDILLDNEQVNAMLQAFRSNEQWAFGNDAAIQAIENLEITYSALYRRASIKVTALIANTKGNVYADLSLEANRLEQDWGVERLSVDRLGLSTPAAQITMEDIIPQIKLQRLPPEYGEQDLQNVILSDALITSVSDISTADQSMRTLNAQLRFQKGWAHFDSTITAKARYEWETGWILDEFSFSEINSSMIPAFEVQGTYSFSGSNDEYGIDRSGTVYIDGYDIGEDGTIHDAIVNIGDSWEVSDWDGYGYYDIATGEVSLSSYNDRWIEIPNGLWGAIMMEENISYELTFRVNDDGTLSNGRITIYGNVKSYVFGSTSPSQTSTISDLTRIDATQQI
jgi:hypothetical protein